MGGGELSLTDQEGEAASGGDQAGRYWEDGVKALDGAEGYYFGGRVGEILCAAGEYIDVCQCKPAGDFAQKGRLLLVRFDECQVDMGGPHFNGKSGETGAGSDVDHGARARTLAPTLFCGEEVAGGEEGFAEVAGYDFFRLADGGEVDAGIPAQEYIDIRRYISQLGLVEYCRFLASPGTTGVIEERLQ